MVASPSAFPNGKSYLQQVHGLNTQSIAKILDRAGNCAIYGKEPYRIRVIYIGSMGLDHYNSIGLEC